MYYRYFPHRNTKQFINYLNIEIVSLENVVKQNIYATLRQMKEQEPIKTNTTQNAKRKYKC